MSNVLYIEGLRAGYGSGDILQGVALEVKEGEVVGVLGRNGVGKTTLMRTIMGLNKATAGTVTHRGKDVTHSSPEERATGGFGYVPQGRLVFPHMSVEDNLKVGALERGRRRELIERMYDRFPRLRERKRQRAGTLSGGEQEMLVIARALVGDPDILLLDEPSEGVQPNIVKGLGELVRELNASGMTILLVEQNIDLMRSAAHRGYVMEKGRITQELPEKQMSNEVELRRVLSL